jgi:hypothetical protein
VEAESQSLDDRKVFDMKFNQHAEGSMVIVAGAVTARGVYR